MTTAQVERSTLLLLIAINGVMFIALTASSAPDLIVGTVVCAIVVRGGIRILRAAAASLKEARGRPATG